MYQGFHGGLHGLRRRPFVFCLLQTLCFQRQEAGGETCAHRGDIECPYRLLVHVQPRRPVRDHLPGEGYLLQAHQIREHGSDKDDGQCGPPLSGIVKRRNGVPAQVPAQVGPHQIDDHVGRPPKDPFIDREDRHKTGNQNQADPEIHPKFHLRLEFLSFRFHGKAKVRIFG